MATRTKRKLYPKDNMVKILLVVIVAWFILMLAGNQIRTAMVQTEELKATWTGWRVLQI